MTDATAAARSVIVEREMRHPPEKVWRALTQSALIEEWLMKNDFELEVGRRFAFRAPPTPHWNGVVEGEVIAIEAPRRLAYRWDAEGGIRTVVTWTLAPTATGTLVRMEQSGFGADQDANYQGARYGWSKYFEGLERVVAGLD